MGYNKQQRICDCHLRLGGCYCSLINTKEYDKGTIRDSERDNNSGKQLLRDRLQNKE